jgi:hypothetical protein
MPGQVQTEAQFDVTFSLVFGPVCIHCGAPSVLHMVIKSVGGSLGQQ